MTFLGHKPDGSHDLVINHKDTNKINNKLYNLEIVTSRYNVTHSTLLNKTSSKYTGVSWYKRQFKWLSKIYVGGKFYHLGYFENEIHASYRYNEALINLENGTFELYYLKLNITNKKKVNKYDLKGNFIETYESVTSAAIINKMDESNISICCRGKQKTSGGYKWSYVD